MRTQGDEEEQRRGVHQTILVGALDSPRLFTLCLMGFCILLGVNIAALYESNRNAEERLHTQIEAQRQLEREVRLLGVNVQDQNAILLREGMIRPGDALDPTAPHR